MNNWFGKLQSIGKALMLPIAVLPAAALLLRFGAPDVLNIPFITKAGGAVFDNLALIFAIGIAVGLAKDNNGASGLAGGIGYLILTAGLKAIDKEIKEIVNDSAEFAKDSPEPPLEELWTDIYAKADA